MPESTPFANDQCGKPDPRSSPESATVVPSQEIGGRGGLEPTRYGDWEKNGRCIDF